ncbi:MAG: SDR family oxidoreductase [Rikenellaceae bacterium]|nr:SDR family oxidoreductase [Rikenellaceae bacterium]
MSLFDLTGKSVVVTGASSGLGADAARSYGQAGAKVALLARRKEKLDSLAQELRLSGTEALAVECDVSSEASVEHAVGEVVDAFGRIDVLLNNAGVAIPGSVEYISLDDWDRIMSINVKGIYLMCRTVVPHMRRQKYGKIVNISSINATLADKNPALARHAYNASKAAVKGLTIGLAASYAGENITVNSIGPGLFESEMTENTLMKHEEFMKLYNFVNPSSRPGARGELNGTIIYFSSDASSYVTGQHIIVDGGFSIV